MMRGLKATIARRVLIIAAPTTVAPIVAATIIAAPTTAAPIVAATTIVRLSQPRTAQGNRAGRVPPRLRVGIVRKVKDKDKAAKDKAAKVKVAKVKVATATARLVQVVRVKAAAMAIVPRRRVVKVKGVTGTVHKVKDRAVTAIVRRVKVRVEATSVAPVPRAGLAAVLR